MKNKEILPIIKLNFQFTQSRSEGWGHRFNKTIHFFERSSKQQNHYFSTVEEKQTHLEIAIQL